MKILQLCSKVPYPPLDGGAIASLNLAKGFVENGNVVDILAMNTPKHYQSPELSFIKNNLQLIPVDVDTRIKPFKLLLNFLFSRLPYNAVRFISTSYAKKLVIFIKSQNYDIIQLEGLYVAPYIKVIRKNSKALIAFRAHNIEHEIWNRSLMLTKGVKKMYLKNLGKRLERFEKSFINKYDVLIPITKRDDDIFTKLSNIKPSFISPTGIDLSKLESTKGTEKSPSLFYLGALDWFPNQEGLIWFIEKVWTKFHTSHPELKFYVAGRNAPEWLEKKLKQHPIVYLGEIENAHKFITSKGIMIVPLFSGSGMRIKIIEGMALGKVIIATPIAAEGIDVSHSENIIIAKNEEEYINNIEILLKNRQLYSDIGRNAQKFIYKNYDNKTISSSLAEFYKSQLK